MNLGLAGKTVIVTGGGSNIGRAILVTFVEEGANVINAQRDERQGQKTVDEAYGLGGQAIFIKTDVTSWDSVQAMVRKTMERFGKIDVLVNNVGGATRPRLFVEKPREEYERDISLNFWSAINCIKAVVDHMVERKYGKIVNIGSEAGRIGASTAAIYSGTKGAIMTLSKALAKELGRYNINVNVVCPGLTVPESREHVGEKSWWREWGFDFYTPEVQQEVVKAIPIGRLGRSQDIANMVVFLASDCASYITGQTISVSGGATMM